MLEYWAGPITPLLHFSNTPFFYNRIKRPRIVVQDLLPQLRRNIFADIERVDELVFARRIVMRIVGTDQQMILAGAFGDIGNILVRFASDIEPVLAEQFLAAARI